MSNKETGIIGENRACSFLIRKKFKILYRNQRENSDEIDIIASSFQGMLVFVEVKTIMPKSHFSPIILPEDHMTLKKFNRIKRGSLMFIAKHPELVFDKSGWRIDLIAIRLKGAQLTNIKHYESIYLQKHESL